MSGNEHQLELAIPTTPRSLSVRKDARITARGQIHYLSQPILCPLKLFTCRHFGFVANEAVVIVTIIKPIKSIGAAILI
jgi:hypothetical protein